MICDLLANVVWLLHVLFVLWVVITPFTSSHQALLMHLILLPFIFVHWILNDDTCALTLAEMKLRGLDPDQCSESFFFNLVSPIYKIRDESVRSLAWALAVGLWLVTAYRVYNNPAIVKDFWAQLKRAWSCNKSTRDTTASTTTTTTTSATSGRDEGAGAGAGGTSEGEKEGEDAFSGDVTGGTRRTAEPVRPKRKKSSAAEDYGTTASASAS